MKQGLALKGVFPFRLGTTSYIIPADILPNIHFLKERVDDVQLVLFESHDASNLPAPGVVRELAAIGRDYDLTYTIHFPLDVMLGARPESRRIAAVDTCCRIIDLCRPLAPRTYALHFAGDDPGDLGPRPSVDMEAWRAASSRSLESLVAEVGAPREICVETLCYAFDQVGDIVEAHDAGVCLDIGHLLRWGHDVEAHLARWGDRAHLMHIHGVKAGRDHRSLRDLEAGLLHAALDRMTPRQGEYRAVTVEVFDEPKFNVSMDVLVSNAERFGGIDA